MFFRGSSSSIRRIANYKAKVRAYTGTGTAPDYTAPVVQFKLGSMYQGFQGSVDDQLTYTGAVFATLAGEPAVKTVQYPFYMAFAGQLYSISRRILEIGTLGLSKKCLLAPRCSKGQRVACASDASAAVADGRFRVWLRLCSKMGSFYSPTLPI